MCGRSYVGHCLFAADVHHDTAANIACTVHYDTDTSLRGLYSNTQIPPPKTVPTSRQSPSSRGLGEWRELLLFWDSQVVPTSPFPPKVDEGFCASTRSTGPSTATTVFMNGQLVGAHRNPATLISDLKWMRRKGLIFQFVSVYLHENTRTINIACDEGRLCRPMIIVDEASGAPMFDPKLHVPKLMNGQWTFDDFIKRGIVEFVDVNEENNLLIAMEGDQIVAGEHTHLEIEPLSLLGMVSGLIAYPNHNQVGVFFGRVCFAGGFFNGQLCVCYGRAEDLSVFDFRGRFFERERVFGEGVGGWGWRIGFVLVIVNVIGEDSIRRRWIAKEPSLGRDHVHSVCPVRIGKYRKKCDEEDPPVISNHTHQPPLFPLQSPHQPPPKNHKPKMIPPSPPATRTPVRWTYNLPILSTSPVPPQHVHLCDGQAGHGLYWV